MSTMVKTVNKFFKTAIKSEVDEVKSKILLSERQEDIFERYYIKKQDVNFIADTLNICPIVVSNELRLIRFKLMKILDC